MTNRRGGKRTGTRGVALQANALSGLIAFGVFVGAMVGIFTPDAPPSSLVQTVSFPFDLCGSARRQNCVVDGDTFWYRGEKIRIADIDTPELSPPRCAREKALGEAAKRELLTQLNAGAFEIAAAGGRDTDRYGRKLRTVIRNGRSIGDALVAKGLARRWEGSRQGWCG
ncbi:thermonuclease family protein [Pseudomonas sp. R2.Fl]|nr:thermonuclease family protein [Pseudomonas sp. R2.Fl]